MTLRTRSTTAGLAKQSGKGSPETDPLFTFGLTGGVAATAEVEEDDVDATADTRLTLARNRTAVMPGSEIELIGMNKTIGLLLLGATGAVASSGADPDFTHDFTASDDVPYFTVFGDFAGERTVVEDAKVGSLEVGFSGTEPAEVSAEFAGLGVEFDADDFTATDSHESPEGGNFLRGVGGTFNFDGSTAKVSEGAVSISNELAPIVLADSVLPNDVPVTKQVVEVSLTVVPDDLDDWQAILTGSGAGSDVADTVFEAAADFTLTDGDNTLQFVANTASWIASHPEADPGGEPAELELEGVVTANSSGEPYQFTLDNGVDSY